MDPSMKLKGKKKWNLHAATCSQLLKSQQFSEPVSRTPHRFADNDIKKIRDENNAIT